MSRCTRWTVTNDLVVVQKTVCMSFSFFQTLLHESLEFLSPAVDEGRRAVLRDAVMQADTLEELGLLTLLPGLRFDDRAERPESTLWALLGESRSLVIVVTRLVLVHPVVLKRHHVLPQDGTLYSVMGGVGDGERWHPLPHSIGRCRVDDDGSLQWLDDMARTKDRKYGLLHRFQWQKTSAVLPKRRSSANQNETVTLVYRTYHGEKIEVQGVVTPQHHAQLKLGVDRKPGRWVKGLLPYRAGPLNYWTEDVRTTLTGEWFHGWKFLHPVWLDQWVKLRLRFRGAEEPWRELKGLVVGPLLEGDRPTLEHEAEGWRVRVVSTVSQISDTSGRSMFFPYEYEVTKADGSGPWVVRADYKDSVAYFPNGTMNWLGPGRIYDEHQREVGVCILETHQLQSMDEVIGTTLQLAGFVDRRDDDTRNDWELFRP